MSDFMKYAAGYLAFAIVALLVYERVAPSWLSSFPSKSPKPEIPLVGFVSGDPTAGDRVASVELLEASGQSMPVSDFRGRFVVLSIVTERCTPCVQELEQLDALAARLPDAGFVFVALVLNAPDDSASRPPISALPLKLLRVYLGHYGAVKDSLKLWGVPTTIVIAPSGREIGRTVGPADWDRRAVASALIGLETDVATTGR